MGAGHADRRSGHFTEVDIQSAGTSARHVEADGVLTGVTRSGLEGRAVVASCNRVMVIGRAWLMLVSRRTVVMLGMVVADVLVDVGRRGHAG